MNKIQFEIYDENISHTIGKIKNPEKAMKKFKRIGGIDVYLLRDFLDKLPKYDENICIGVYVTKKDIKENKKRDIQEVKKGTLAPLHCKGFLLAPIKTYEKVNKRIQDEREF